nr:cation:proton antiporter [Massilia sp. TS11]
MAGMLVPLLQRLRFNPVLGFLVAGVVFGPHGLGSWAGDWPVLQWLSFSNPDEADVLAELGILFLMFMIGLELSAERLWSLRRWVFGGGTAQVLLGAAGIGACAYAFGNAPAGALVLGLVLSLSSTAMVMPLMEEARLLATPMGQAVFSVLMLQDLAVVPIMILIGVLSGGVGDGLGSLVLWTLLKSVGAIVLIYLLGRRLIRPTFAYFVRQRQPDVFMALTLLSTLGIAALTAKAGLSPALGALLAGLLLAETEFRHEVEITIEPFKGLLMGLFFMSVGMEIDLRAVLAAPLLLPLSVLGLFLIKTLALGSVLKLGGLSWGRALHGGLLMGQGGEFAFVVVAEAVTRHLLPEPTGKFMLLVVGLSLLVSPLMARLGMKLGARLDAGQQAPADMPSVADAAGCVIIAGFGRVGQMLAQLLERQGIAYIAFESNPQLVATARAAGRPVYFGDAGRAALLHKAHVDGARAIVLTMDHPGAALNAVRGIRASYPHLPVFARCRDERHARLLHEAGATLVVPETLESSLQLSAHVLRMLGVPDSSTEHMIDLERERHLDRLHGAMEAR